MNLLDQAGVDQDIASLRQWAETHARLGLQQAFQVQRLIADHDRLRLAEEQRRVEQDADQG